PDQVLDQGTTAGDEPAQPVTGEQVLPGVLVAPFAEVKHRAGGQGAGELAALLHAGQERADQPRIPFRHQRRPARRALCRRGNPGRRCLVRLQIGGELRVLFGGPGPPRDALVQVIDILQLVRVLFEVLLQAGVQAGEIVAAFGGLVAQPLEELGGHRRPLGVGAERLPEEDVGVVVRGDALAQPLVQRLRVVEGAVLADRAADVGRLLADREAGLALLLALVAWHWRLQGERLAPTSQQTETQQEQTGSERAHDAVPPRGEVRERTLSSAFSLPGERQRRKENPGASRRTDAL